MGWKFYRIRSTDRFHDQSAEQLRLFDAASDAIKTHLNVEHAPTPPQPTMEAFEETAPQKTDRAAAQNRELLPVKETDEKNKMFSPGSHLRGPGFLLSPISPTITALLQ